MADSALTIEQLSFRYRTAETPAISAIDVRVDGGEVLLIAGPSGCGKSTLLRCINGLIPRSYRGELAGRVTIAGQAVADLPLSRLARLVGTVLQDPEKQIVASYVAEEVAFGPENLGWPRSQVLAAVDAALAELDITHLRGRETYRLSGGEKQKVALAGLLAMEPRLLLLDEPLASLDPLAAQHALEVIRAQADRGRSIVVVEHRVDDALSIGPERAMLMHEGRQAYLGAAAGLAAVADPLLVKLPADAALERLRERPQIEAPAPPARRAAGEPLVEIENVEFRYGDDGPPVLKGVSLTIRKGDVIALLGPNGSGKSTLVKHIVGLNRPQRGTVRVEGRDTRAATTAQLARSVGFVFQSPTHMLFAPTVREELAFGPRNLGVDPATIERTTAHALELLRLEDHLERAPLSLSFGQQKRVGIAAVLAMESRILVMDEPTAGQDYASYTRFMDEIASLDAFDALLFVTHDLDLALSYANRVLLFNDGQLAADGTPEDVLPDTALLRRCHVLPTSLLELNLQLLPQTGRMLGLRQLAAYLQQTEGGDRVLGTTPSQRYGA
ncbi:MAG: ABC transporter ATP-binding protein [Chloroflexi bacterium OHK40]